MVGPGSRKVIVQARRASGMVIACGGLGAAGDGDNGLCLEQAER